MIRWYDWIIALVAADIFLTNIIVALTSDAWWISFLASLVAWMVWDLWNNLYCKIRLIQEQELKK